MSSSALTMLLTRRCSSYQSHANLRHHRVVVARIIPITMTLIIIIIPIDEGDLSHVYDADRVADAEQAVRRGVARGGHHAAHVAEALELITKVHFSQLSCERIQQPHAVAVPVHGQHIVTMMMMQMQQRQQTALSSSSEAKLRMMMIIMMIMMMRMMISIAEMQIIRCDDSARSRHQKHILRIMLITCREQMPLLITMTMTMTITITTMIITMLIIMMMMMMTLL